MGTIFQIFREEVCAECQMVCPAAGFGAERRFHAFRCSYFQSPINFVRGDVIEPVPCGNVVLLPFDSGGLQERKRPHHVGLCKGERILDAAVHVAFRGQVDDAVHVILLHHATHAIEVADVHSDEAVVGAVLYVLEIGQVAGVSEFVKVDDVVFGVFVDKEAHHVRSDESRASCYQNVPFHVFNV